MSSRSQGTARLRSGQFDDRIEQDPTARRGVLSHNLAGHAVLAARHPEATPLVEAVKVGEVDVCLVEDDDLTGTDIRAQFRRFGRVVRLRRLDQRETRQECLQVQPHVALRGRLAPPVLGPVHAVGHQLDGRRVNHVDHTFEASRKADVLAPHAEGGGLAPQVLQRRPEQLLGHIGVALAVGVRQSIAARGDGPTDSAQRTAVGAQVIAEVVETERVGQLRMDQSNHMAPGSERPTLLVHAVLARELRDLVGRDQFDNLPQDGHVTLGWLHG